MVVEQAAPLQVHEFYWQITVKDSLNLVWFSCVYGSCQCILHGPPGKQYGQFLSSVTSMLPM